MDLADTYSAPMPARPHRPQVKIAGPSGDNATRNRQALKRMSELEILSGMTPEAWSEFHAAQRARVRARWGLAEAA